MFDFGPAAVPSPRMTRARRASISLEPVARSKAKRMSLAPSMTRLKEEAPKPPNRRRSMAVPAKKAPSPKLTTKPINSRRSLAVGSKKMPVTPKKNIKPVDEEDEEEFIFDPTPTRGIKQSPATPSKGIAPVSFYTSPTKRPSAKGAAIVANRLAASPTKMSSAVSPTKKFAKNTSRILTEEDILESLMVEGKTKPTFFTKKVQKKTQLPVSPTKKPASSTMNRTLTEKDIEAELMAEFETPDAKIQPKTFKTDIPTEKVKPRRKEVEVKSPVIKAFKGKTPAKKSKIAVKSPTTPSGTDAGFVPQLLPVGSPVIRSIIKEVRSVKVRLTPLRIKEDPNVIFSMLEQEHAAKDRVGRVVEALVARSQEKKSKTRRSLDSEETMDGDVETPKKTKAGRPAKVKKQLVPEVEVKLEKRTPKAVKTPKIGNTSQAVETPKAGETPKAVETPKVQPSLKKKPGRPMKIVETPKVEPTPKSKQGRPPKSAKKQEAVIKTEVETPKTVKTVATSSRAVETPKAASTPKAKPGRPSKKQDPVIKNEVETPKTTKVTKTPKATKTPKSKQGLPPKSAKKSKTDEALVADSQERTKADVAKMLKALAEVERDSIDSPRGQKRALETPPAPSNKRLRTVEPSAKQSEKTPKVKVTPKVKAKVSPKVTPLMARFKQQKKVTPISAIKKPLKRLGKAAAVTPAQIKPADMLRRNLKNKVAVAIEAKVAARPDSSPYTLDTTENSSPVFQRVQQEKKVVVHHLTGTPARAAPRSRKFGTALQPSLLLDSSELPTGKRQSVSSSTPLRPLPNPSPHPLESVEATPILAPAPAVSPTSPQPQMMTGRLANMCAIM